MHENIVESVIRFFADRGIALKLVNAFSQSFELTGMINIVTFENSQRSRQFEAAFGVETRRLTIIITNQVTGARLNLAHSGEPVGDVSCQLKAIASDFPELDDVVAGKKWVDRPFDWRDYK
jgi:hypothetical protein